MINKSTLLGLHHINREVEGFNISLTTYADNKEFETWHSHNRASLSFLLEGVYEEDLENKHLKRYPGDVKFIPEGLMHRCRNYSGNTKKINLEFDTHLLAERNIGEKSIHYVMTNPLQAKLILLKLFVTIQASFQHKSGNVNNFRFE